MDSKVESLKATCKQFLDSLLANKNRHTLCLNIEAEGVEAQQVALEHLKAKGAPDVSHHSEPSTSEFEALLKDISGKTVIVSFADLDKHPKSIDLLAAHVRLPQPGGKLVVVSRHWNSDNTEKEREGYLPSPRATIRFAGRRRPPLKYRPVFRRAASLRGSRLVASARSGNLAGALAQRW